MSALSAVTAAGGRVWAEGDKLRYRLPKGRDDLLDALRVEKPRLLPLLRACEALCRESGADALALAAAIEAAHTRLSRELAEHPAIRFSCETINPDADPVLVAIGVRHAGYATLAIPKANYDEAKVLTIIHRLPAATTRGGK